MKIGTRLGLSFGVILVAASAMMAGALVSAGTSRTALLDTLQQAKEREALAVEMQQQLLQGGLSGGTAASALASATSRPAPRTKFCR